MALTKTQRATVRQLLADNEWHGVRDLADAAKVEPQRVETWLRAQRDVEPYWSGSRGSAPSQFSRLFRMRRKTVREPQPPVRETPALEVAC